MCNYLFQMPTIPEEWQSVSQEFESKFKIRKCVGAIDGKHVAIVKPTNSGSTYYNYKNFFSIVLLAVVSARKKFIMVDVGTNGRISDGGVMFHSKFGELFQTGKLNLPPPSPLSNSLQNFPYVFVADEAFALHRNLMKPYAKKDLDEEKHVVFNKILSSARSVVENAFGILTARFRVLLSTMYLDPKKASIVTLACCYLHNFLIEENGTNYLPGNGETLDTSTLVQLQRTKRKNNPTAAKAVRDSFADYYYSQERVQRYEESEEI